MEGWQVWDVAQRMSGQLRAIPGAVLSYGPDDRSRLLATALGVSPTAVAELLPEIEAVAVRKLNERIGANNNGSNA